MLKNVMYWLDEFRLYEDDDGHPRLRLRGWLHCRQSFSHLANAALGLTLRAPGGPGLERPVTQTGERTGFIGRLVGEEASASGFLLDEPVEDAGLELDRARLVVSFPDGDELSMDVGRRFTGAFADPERLAAERALVMSFEGIGNNCEFGLMQRKVGFNRMGLLRFAGSQDTPKLAEAIANGFDGFGTPDDLGMSLRGTEWIAESRRYGFSIHTYRHFPAMSEEDIRREESTKLTFQTGMLLDLLENGGRILVRRVADEDNSEGMRALYEAVRSRGPVSLLWVTNARPDKPHASIERLDDGFYVAYHASLARTDWPTEFDRPAWMTLLAAARDVVASHKEPWAA